MSPDRFMCKSTASGAVWGTPKSLRNRGLASGHTSLDIAPLDYPSPDLFLSASLYFLSAVY